MIVATHLTTVNYSARATRESEWGHRRRGWKKKCASIKFIAAQWQRIRKWQEFCPQFAVSHSLVCAMWCKCIIRKWLNCRYTLYALIIFLLFVFRSSFDSSDAFWIFIGFYWHFTTIGTRYGVQRSYSMPCIQLVRLFRYARELEHIVWMSRQRKKKIVCNTYSTRVRCWRRAWVGKVLFVNCRTHARHNFRRKVAFSQPNYVSETLKPKVGAHEENRKSQLKVTQKTCIFCFVAFQLVF